MRALAVLYVLGVLALTTGPQPPGRLDIVGNIVLFVPLGALVMVRWPRLHPFWTVAAGFALSTTIEAAQLWVLTARDATVNDIALNTGGAALGWVAGSTFASIVRRAARALRYARGGKLAE